MMKKLLRLLCNILLGSEKTSDLALENLALRQQLAAMKRSIKRPQLRYVQNVLRKNERPQYLGGGGFWKLVDFQSAITGK